LIVQCFERQLMHLYVQYILQSHDPAYPNDPADIEELLERTGAHTFAELTRPGPGQIRELAAASCHGTRRAA